MCGAGEDYLAVDVLTGILAFLRAERLTGNEERIHESFFGLLGKYPGLSRSFIFVQAGNGHYSEELDGALQKLRLEGTIATGDTSWEITINPEARKKLADYAARRFTAEEREALRRLAGELETLLRV